MIIPRSLRIALTALDTNQCGKQLSSERATGKVGHSMAQQTAMQEPQEARLFAGAEERGHGRLQSMPGTALPWPSPQLTSHSVPGAHLSLPVAKAAQPSHATSSLPLHDNSLALLPGTEL